MRGQRGVTVVGSAHVAAPVDQVELALGVEILRADAAASFTDAAVSVSAVLAILADGGVDSRHVRTTDLHLGPRTTYRDNQEVLIGYACGQRLIAVLGALGALPELLGRLAVSGVEGVRFEGISFSASDVTSFAERARAQAMADAHSKAQHLAALAGRVLGPVVAIREQQPGGRPFPMAKRELAMDTAMAVATGDTEVSASVEVHFELV